MESILQWNMRGYYSHKDGLDRIIRDYTPFAIAIQETKLSPGQSLRLRGYAPFTYEVQPEPNGRAHGGVAVCVRDSITAARINLNTSLQAVAVRISVPLEVTLVSLYLPNSQWQRDDLEALLRQLPSPVLIMGDFNAHNIWWGETLTDVPGRNLEEMINETNLILLNNGAPTRFDAGSGRFSAIDLSLASPAIAIRISEWTPLQDLYHSDHFPIILTSSMIRAEYIIPARYDTKRADWPAFSAKMVIPPETRNVNNDILNFTKAILTAAQGTIPKIGGNVLKRPPVPWWNQECSDANAAKKRAFNRLKRYPTQENLIHFKRCRAKERKLIKECKKKSLSSYVDTITTATTSREVWHKVRNISGGYRPPAIPALVVNGIGITDSVNVAEILAQQFEQVSSSMSYSPTFLKQKYEAEKQFLNFNADTTEAYNAPLSFEELKHVLDSIKDSTPGPDGVPYAMIRNIPASAKEFLLRLYNNVWDSGEYPDCWREALMIPIPKVGKDLSNPSNYRPISLTACLSKVLETMINKRLVYVLEKQGLYNQTQAGFRKFHSTMDQLCLLEAYIQNAFVRREHVLAVFFDLEKAYDTTWRYGILRKCHQWGLRGRLPQFLDSFLSERRFRVRLGSTLSRTHTQENGIPQGSVLSVTLFAVAVNNIADNVQEPILKSLYVDDLAILLSGNDILEVSTSLQDAIDEVHQEAERNGFKVSTEKSVCIHFCRKRRTHSSPTLYLNGTPLPFKEKIKFLGLVFDNKLYWQDHINYLTVKTKETLNILKFLCSYKWGTDKKILMQLFNCLTRSKLEYGAPVYSSARKSRLKKLDTVYNEGIRLVTGAFRTSPLNSLYVEAGVLPPNLRREWCTLSYAAGVWGKPWHPIYPTVFEADMRREYQRQKTRTRPLAVRAAEIIEETGSELGPVWNWSIAPSPPWTLPRIPIRLDLAQYQKENTAPIVYRIKFLELLSSFIGYRTIYTDGSKVHDGVGCAVHSMGTTLSWTLPHYASVYTAELTALYQALHLCQNNWTETKFIICTDSLSALNAINNMFSVDPLIIKVRELYGELYTNGKEMVLVWIPGHVGIIGNETADVTAKTAAATPPSEVISVHPKDIKKYLQRTIWIKWQDTWHESEEKLKRFKPLVQPGPTDNLARRQQVILTRLRIGHTRVTHEHLLNGTAAPRCPKCNAEQFTVLHILENCEFLRRIRECNGLEYNSQDVLKPGSDTAKLFLFLKLTDLFNRI